ncbi:response regulator [Pseudoduganella sp. LjRoot289]|uniref:response regulator n=1 Tax=Pseudoduganella sp. LjRoot289 TaxID=3342314 RepID=UPI003ECF458E
MAARVLIIEDNQANMDLMSYLLAAFGHTPLCAYDGEQGVAMARAELPDLILCDLHLPKLDGYGVVRQLKAAPATAAIPVLAASALPVGDGGEALRAAGFDGHLPKSLEPDTLIPSMEVFLPPALRELSDPGPAASRDASDPSSPSGAAQVPGSAGATGPASPPDVDGSSGPAAAACAAPGGASAAAPAGQVVPPAAEPPRTRVLLLDAVSDGCGLVASILAHYGYVLTVVVNAEQAADCAGQRFDLLLCDIDPRRARPDGFPASALLRWPALPLVLIRPAADEAVEGLLHGAVRPRMLLLSHPLEPQQLAEAVEQCMTGAVAQLPK